MPFKFSRNPRKDAIRMHKMRLYRQMRKSCAADAFTYDALV
jgi:hypothetical protein